MGKTEIIALTSWNFLWLLCDSVIFPFLPLEFEKLGLDVSIYGYIFAMYAFANMIGSLIVGKLFSILKRKIILVLGIGSTGLSLIAFGFIVYWRSNVELTIVSLAIRALQGIGASMIMTTSYAMVAVVYRDDQQKYFGILESSQGIGLISGPAIGSALYTLIGFQLTLYSVGGAFLLLAPTLYLLIPNSVNRNEEFYHSIVSNYSRNSSYIAKFRSESIEVKNIVNDSSEDTKTTDEREESLNFAKHSSIKYSEILFRPIALITFISTFFALWWLTYFEPTLSIRLDDYGLSSLWIGVFFSLSPITYTISSLSISWMTSKIDAKYLICIGLLFNGIAQLLVGPSPFLPDSLILMALGQLLHGFTVCLFLITSLPVIIEDAIINYPHKKIEVSDASAAIFNAFQSIGNMVGPILLNTK